MRYIRALVTWGLAVHCVFSLRVESSLANDAPVNLQGGGAQPLTGPLKVKMDSEVVTIIPGKNSYIVDATFNFSNMGETVELSVGFPKNGGGYLDDRFDHTADFISFKTWVEGKEVEVNEEPNAAGLEGSYTLPDLINHIKHSDKLETLGLTAKDHRWMVKKVRFLSERVTTTRVRYEAPYQDFGGECKGGIRYTYGTGSFWDGNIGKSTFIVDATRIPKKDRPKRMIFDEKEKGAARCNTPKDGSLKCTIQNYKPKRPDAYVVVGVGCMPN